MKWCWAQKTEERPNFKQVTEEINKMLESTNQSTLSSQSKSKRLTFSIDSGYMHDYE